MSAENVKKTEISTCDTVDGSYTDIAGLVGEIPMPDKEYPVEKFQANDETNPSLIIGDPETSGIEVAVKYANHTVFKAVEALAGTELYIKFTLESGDEYIYFGCISKVSPVTGGENGACVGQVGFEFTHRATDAAAS